MDSVYKYNVKRHVDERPPLSNSGLEFGCHFVRVRGSSGFFWGGPFGDGKIDGYSHVARLTFTCLGDSAVWQSMFCLSRCLSR